MGDYTNAVAIPWWCVSPSRIAHSPSCRPKGHNKCTPLFPRERANPKFGFLGPENHTRHHQDALFMVAPLIFFTTLAVLLNATSSSTSVTAMSLQF